MCATDKRRDLPPTLIVGLSDGTAWRLNRNLQRYLGCTRRLHALADEAAAADGALEARFERLASACKPSAVVVFDGDALTQRCAAVAGRLGVALLHIGADAQVVGEGDDGQSPRQAIRQLAALRFDCQSAQFEAAAATRFAPAHHLGNLLADAIQLASKVAKRESRRSGKALAPGGHVDARRGYGVVALKQPAAGTGTPGAPGVLPLLRELSRDLPLVWPMRHATLLLAHTSGLARTLEGDRIARIEELGYVNFLRLMAGATCVLTDAADVMEEAAILGVPCISLGPRHVSHVQAGGWMRGYEVGGMVANATRAVWQILFSGAGDTSLPVLWDGEAGARIAEQVALWLQRQAALAPQPGALRHPLHEAAGAGLDRSA
jgi:UDP-N-acetylglucosamine 2-epimerase (non-hydrolysing)